MGNRGGASRTNGAVCTEGWRHGVWLSGEWKAEEVAGQLQQQPCKAELVGYGFQSLVW